jgi:hypothetical protein
VVHCKSFSEIIEKMTKVIEGMRQIVFKSDVICCFLRVIGLNVIIGYFRKFKASSMYLINGFESDIK